jgi:hypothetical protein
VRCRDTPLHVTGVHAGIGLGEGSGRLIPVSSCGDSFADFSVAGCNAAFEVGLGIIDLPALIAAPERRASLALERLRPARHIRLLAPLAFVSPRIVSALLDGTAPADLTLTKLARALPYCWAEQERRVGSSAPFHG